MALLVRQLLQVVHLRHMVEEHLGRVPVQVDDEVPGVLLVEVALSVKMGICTTRLRFLDTSHEYIN